MLYKPNRNGVWLFLDYEKIYEAGIPAYWQHTGEFPFFEHVISPEFVIATLNETTFELNVRGSTRFDEIMQAAKISLNSFHEVMVEAKQEQRIPMVSSQQVRVIPHEQRH